MAILGMFWGFFGDRMANWGLIDFKLGLYVKVNVNEWQNKLEVHISKHLANITINWQKIGQMPLLSLNTNGHNSVIFHPILTLFYQVMLVF